MQDTLSYKNGDRSVRHWLLWSLFWFPLFAGFGFILALKFFAPDFLSGTSWLTFGRIRPAHVNGVLFGFLSSCLVATMLYIVPRLCRIPLRHPGLAAAGAWMWNLAVLTGIIMILGGQSQGREYAELPWIIDLAVLATMLLLGYIVLGTIRDRDEKKLYVSIWYYTGTMLWFPIVYIIGNVMWKVPTGALAGTTDAMFNWYYGHNVLGLWFTTLGIPAWYFVIPKGINRPLYSHLLSLIAFFSIAFFYTGVGAHHLLQAPIPEWAKTIGVIMSILMVIPVITFATNIMLTVRGSAGTLFRNIPLRFIVTGFYMYLLASFQGSFQSFRVSNAYTHFSQWPVGHAHLALLGAFGFLAVGLAYWLVPALTGVRVYSQKLMSLSFWLMSTGFLTFFSAMSIAGLVANSAWWDHMGVATVLPLLTVHFIARAIGGGIVVLGAFVFAGNTLMTFLVSREPYEEEKSTAVEEKVSERRHSLLMRRSQEKLNLPIVVFGGLTVFVLMTFMVVAMPFMHAPSEPSERAHELTGAEKDGAALFKSLGCFYCHSQFVRPQDWAMGEVSKAGDFLYSVPHFLGTERTGPNLAQIGGMRPTRWHYLHDRYPRSVSPGSVMPDFAFLKENEIDALVAYVQNLGGYDLEPRGFHPTVPEPYRKADSPYMPMMTKMIAAYQPSNQTYHGDPAEGEAYAKIFEAGKAAHTEKCLPCHGCSGNGQGPYSRMVITRPANLHERLARYPDPRAGFHLWRVSEGVPGTAMPPWRMSLSEDRIWEINLFEMSFVGGAVRTVPGDVSDGEAKEYAADTGIRPPIAGSGEDYRHGREIYDLYCAQCHGEKGDGKGSAAAGSPEGYVSPEPAVFSETGHDFKDYGQYVWKVREGVETTNMPPWKLALDDEEIFTVIFYIQRFAGDDDYKSKWGSLYQDPFAAELKQQP